MREQLRQTETRANMPVANTATTTVTSVTEEEQRENLEALIEAVQEAQREAENGKGLQTHPLDLTHL